MGCIHSKGGETDVKETLTSGSTDDANGGYRQPDEYVELSSRGFRRGRNGARRESMVKKDDDAIREKSWPAWILQYSAEDTIGWLPRKISTYQKVEKIGQGTYSTVYKGMDLVTRRPVALKKVHAEVLDEDSVTFLMREVTLLRALDHPNVLKLLDVASSAEKQTIFLVFEYLEHDLAGLITLKDRSLPVSQIKFFMRQMLEALSHCHSQGIMHRDVKCSNLLLDAKGNLKLGDFGLAIKPHIVDQPLTNRVITLWYRPPELLLGSTRYDYHVDLWSVGCIFAELLHGKPILPGTTEVEQLHQIFKLCGTAGLDALNKEVKVPYAPMMNSAKYPRKLSERFAHFPHDALAVIEKLLSIVPSSRGTARGVLAMPFFTQGEMEERMDLSEIPLSHEYLVKKLQSISEAKADQKAERTRRESIGGERSSQMERVVVSDKPHAPNKLLLDSAKDGPTSIEHMGAVSLGVAPMNPASWRKQRKRRNTMAQGPVMGDLLENELDERESVGSRPVGLSLLKGTFADKQLYDFKNNGHNGVSNMNQGVGGLNRPGRMPRISTSMIPNGSTFGSCERTGTSSAQHSPVMEP